MKKLKHFVKKRKVLSGFIALVIVLLGYFIISKLTSTSGEIRYVLTAVKKGTVMTTVTGSGQVSATNQIELKAKVSGDIVYLGAVNGETIPAGTLIAQVDARSALVDLENAKLALAKLQKPADAVDLIQAENALEDAKQAKLKAENDLAKAYGDAYNNASTAFLNLAATMDGLKELLTSGTGYLGSQKNYSETEIIYHDLAYNSYNKAKEIYDQSLVDFRATSKSSGSDALEALVLRTYETLNTVAQALKDSASAVNYYKDRHTETATSAATAVTNLNTWSSKVSSDLLTISSIKNTIESAKNTLSSSIRSIPEKTEALQELRDGADTLDLQTQVLAVQQKQYNYQDYFSRAPFDGVIGKLNVKKGDSASGGTSLGTFISKQKIADISLNEVDAAKVKVDQLATLTFDAIDGLSITGKVSEVDLVGTVTSGVVTYNVKIGFDTQDERVKSGMSVSAEIVTERKPGVLVVPNGAVKTRGETRYVEMFENKLSATAETSQGAPSSVLPVRREVLTGLNDDLNTEIVSGLKAGDLVVSRTINPSTAKPAASAPSLFGGSNTRTTTTPARPAAGR